MWQKRLFSYAEAARTETPLFFPFMLALFLWDCPLQSSKGILSSSSLLRLRDDRPSPVDSSHTRKPVRCSLICGRSSSNTILMMRESCSLWLRSGMQSKNRYTLMFCSISQIFPLLVCWWSLSVHFGFFCPGNVCDYQLHFPSYHHAISLLN